MKKRLYSLDCIRAFAIIMVLLLHTSLQTFPNHYSGDIDEWRSAPMMDDILFPFINGIGAVGVPLFLILTGYLMVDRDYTVDYLKRFTMRNLLPMIVAYEVWTVILALPSVAKGDNGTLKKLVEAMLFIGPAEGFLWFMQMIIGIYLGIPFLSYVLKTIHSHGVERYAVCVFTVAFVYVSIVPSVQETLSLLHIGFSKSSIDLSLIGASSAVLWLICGYLIKMSAFDKVKDWILIAGLVVAVLLTACQRSLQYMGLIAKSADTYSIPSLFVTACAISILAIRHIDVHGGRNRQGIVRTVVSFISVASFGIYVAHPLGIGLLKKLGVFGLFSSAAVNTLLALVVLFAVTAIGVFVLSRIPFLRKWILMMHG